MSALLRHRPVWVTLLVVVLWSGYQAQGLWAAYLKLDRISFAEGERNLVVTLDFEPEAFHMALLQESGRLIRIDGRDAYLMDVDQDAALDLARRYWVSGVLAWSGE